MKIYVSRDYKKILCMFILYFTIFVGFFIFNFGVTNSVLYTCDIIILFLMLVLLKRNLKAVLNNPMLIPFLIITLLVLQGSICALFNGLSVGRWLWSIRNWARLFVYCLIAFVVLKKKDCDKICEFTLNLYHINVVVVIGQFLFLGNFYGQDSLNGLFGRDTSSVNITMTLIVVAIATAQYVVKQIKWKKFMRVMIEALVVAIVAELRAVTVIVFIIVAVAYFFTFKLTIKNICKVIAFIGIMMQGLQKQAIGLSKGLLMQMSTRRS